MAFSVFDDKSHQPGDPEVSDVLAGTSDLWDELKSTMETTFQTLSADWGFAGKKWGWSLRLKQKSRTVLYMTPRHDHFVVGFALGEKAVNAARESDLSTSVMETINTAQKYAEGRAVRIEVRTVVDLENVIRIAEIKMAT